MQQWRKLRAHGIETPNPRQQVLDDLTNFMSPLATDGHEILLLLDANCCEKVTSSRMVVVGLTTVVY